MPSCTGSKTPLVSTSPPLASFSMTSVGGTRPPAPIRIGVGSGLPVLCTTIVGPVSSVVVRFAVDAPPGRNSETVPVTVAASPTLTDVGEFNVNTKTPSDVATSASASASGSCR